MGKTSITRKMDPGLRRLWLGIGILLFLAPAGLILPELFRAGGAWGEWGAEEVRDMTGYVPEGLKRLSELWSAPMPDYTVFGWDKGIASYAAYVLSGILGVVLVAAAAFLFGRLVGRNK